MTHPPPNFSASISVSDNLVLRSVQRIDAASFLKVIRENKGHFLAFDFISPNFESLKEVEAVIESLVEFKASGNGVNYGLWRQDELLGLFTVNKVNWSKKEADVGFWLVESATGQGLATLAFTRLCNDLFKHGFGRLMASTAVSNQRAQSVLQRSGFKKIEILHEHITVRGQKIDEFVYLQTFPV